MNSKKHKLPRRILAMLLAICMFVTMFPSAMFAVKGEGGGSIPVSTEISDDYVTIDKTATPGKDPGTWNVTLKVSPKDQDISQLSQDVILVLDTSSSMNKMANMWQSRWQVLQSVLIGNNYNEGIIDTLADAGTRVAVVTFASDNQVGVIGDGFNDLSDQDNVEKLKNSIRSFTFDDGRGTDIYAGLEEAVELLDSSNSNSSVILLSDGACDIRFEPYGYNEYRDRPYTYDHSGEINPGDGKGENPHNIGDYYNQKKSYDYSGYLKNYLDDVARDIKEKATLYSISFEGDTNSAGYKTLDRITDDGKLYSSSDYDGLMENFTEITRQILPMIDDPMGEKVEVVGTPTTSLVNSQGSTINTKPAEVINGENGQSIRWNPNLGQSLEPGQTLTITYTVRLKDTSQEALAGLYGTNGSETQVSLNGDAQLNYYIDNNDQVHSLDFPKPEGTVQVGKLVENDYADGEPVEGNTIETYALVGGNNTFNWETPGDTIDVGGTTYAYQNSTYDEVAITGQTHVVEAGEHKLNHYYGTTLNGTEVTIQVYLDGDLVTEPLKDGFVTINRVPGTDSWNKWELKGNNGGTLTYDFNYNPDQKNGHDCVDINVSFDDEKYLLQGVKYNQSSGSGTPEPVSENSGTYKIDNIVAGEKVDGEGYTVDCTIYLYTKYNVEYYLDTDKLGDGENEEVYNDANIYISDKFVTESTDRPEEEANDHAIKVDWMNGKVTYKTDISLVPLPSRDGYTISGWKLSSIEGTSYEDETTVTVANVITGLSGTVIPFYATSTENPKDLDSITKEVVTQDDVNSLPETLKKAVTAGTYDIPENDKTMTFNEGEKNSVTLLYKITVTGDPGTIYEVADEQAAFVDPTSDTGEIPDGSTATLYVARTFDLQVGTNTFTNSASVTNKDGGNVPEDNLAEDTVTVEVVPDGPTDGEVTDAFGDVVKLDCVGTYYGETHTEGLYSLPSGGFSIDEPTKDEDGSYYVTITVDPNAEYRTKYEDLYNAEANTHNGGVTTHTMVEDQKAQTLQLEYVNGEWVKPDNKVTYISFNLTCADPQNITAFKKEVVTSSVEGIDDTYQYPKQDENGALTLSVESGTDVTLLYKITVTGYKNVGFTIKDDDTVLVKVEGASGEDLIVGTTEDSYTGTINADNGVAVLYVAKNFGTVDSDRNLENTAAVVNGSGGTQPDPDDDDKVVIPVEVTYTLNYNANDGKYLGGFSGKDVATVSGLKNGEYEIWTKDDTGKEVGKMPKNEILPVHDPVEENDVLFIGWSLKDDDKIYERGDTLPNDVLYDVDDKVTIAGEDATLYAVWGYDKDGGGTPDVFEDSYSLTYDANGGYGTMPVDKNAYVKGDTATLETEAVPDHKPDANGTIVFLGWSTTQTTMIYGAGGNYGEVVTDSVTFADKDITVYAVWGYDTNGDNIADATQVMIEPAAITIYTGGNGYEGTVGNVNGSLLNNNESGLPEPGFYFTLPYDMNEAIKRAANVETTTDLSRYLTITAEAHNDTGTSEDRSWTISLYDADGTTDVNGRYVYSFAAAAGQDPVRMQFTDENGNIQLSDEFNITDALYQQYTMSLYTGAVDAGTVTAVAHNLGEDVSDMTATVSCGQHINHPWGIWSGNQN